MDVLIVRLRSSGFGCYLFGVYFGCLMFADAILLLHVGLAHTVSGMRHILKIVISPYAVDYDVKFNSNKLCGRPHDMPRPCKLTFDLLTWKWCPRATSLPILVFLGLSVLDLDPMYAIDRQTSDVHHRLMPLPWGGDVKSLLLCVLILAMMPCVRAAWADWWSSLLCYIS